MQIHKCSQQNWTYCQQNWTYWQQNWTYCQQNWTYCQQNWAFCQQNWTYCQQNWTYCQQNAVLRSKRQPEQKFLAGAALAYNFDLFTAEACTIVPINERTSIAVHPPIGKCTDTAVTSSTNLWLGRGNTVVPVHSPSGNAAAAPPLCWRG